MWREGVPEELQKVLQGQLIARTFEEVLMADIFEGGEGFGLTIL